MYRLSRLQPLPSPVYLCLIGLFVVIAYYPGLHTPFIFDDLPNIVLNTFVHPQSFSGIVNAVNSEISATRPLAMLSFAVNFWLGGLDVFGYHLVNLVVHLGNAVVLYYCIVTLFEIPQSRLHGTLEDNDIRILAFWSAMLWVLNPVQHQAVTYIVQRMTSLATLFYLLSIFSYLKYRSGEYGLITAFCMVSLFFAAGMACKEIVVTLPVCLVLIDIFFIKPDHPFTAKWFVIAIGIVILTSTLYVYGKLPDFFEKFPDRDYSPYQRLLTEPRVLWHYLSLYFFPLPERLHLEYGFSVSTFLFQPVTTFISLAAVIMSLIISWVLRNRLPLLSFAVFFFFLASSVEASFLNLELAYLHRLYLPSLFIFPGLLSVLPVAGKKYLGPSLIVVMALFTFATQQRNHDWQSRAGLWQADYSGNVNASRSIVNGGIALLEQGRYEEVISLLALKYDSLNGPARYSALYTLAMAYYYKGEFNSALSYLESIDDNYGDFDQVLFYEGMSHINLNMGMEKQVEKLRHDFPEKPYSSILTAENLRRAGKFEDGVQVLEKAIAAIKPENIIELNLARAYLANVYLDMKQYVRAYALYLEIIKADPNAFFAWKQIYAMQVSAGDLEHANIIRAMLESKGVTVPLAPHPDKVRPGR